MKKKTFILTLILLFNFIFLDIVNAEVYDNYSDIAPVSCGNNLLTNIPATIPRIISILYTVIQIAVPIVLVILGSIDLIKGITAGKEDDVKKGQQMFVKRLIAAAIVFFVFILVKFVISLVADATGARILECATCFIKNVCN